MKNILECLYSFYIIPKCIELKPQEQVKTEENQVY